MIIQDSRIQLKYSTIPGVVPTIPLTYDHTDGTWLPTDLYIGEVFFNSADNLAWWRSETGLVPFGATGSTGPFIGDFVPASVGGTYGGPVYGPEFNATLIDGDTVQGVTGSFSGPVSASTFYGDGSNLTGIVATWNGGTVGGTATFQNDVIFEQDLTTNQITADSGTLNIDGAIDTNAGATFNGNVTALSFIGDGSQLTGITGGTDTYTTAANLVGNTIQFDRTDLANAYSVDLSAIAGAPVSAISWDPLTNELLLELGDGTTFPLTINNFTDLTVFGQMTADYFVGDGSQLTNLPTTTGPTGPTGPAGPTGSAGPAPYMVISYASTGLTLALGTVTLPVTTTLYIGWNTGTRLRIWHDATHYMEGVVTTAMTYPQVAGNNINVLIDYVVGTGTPGSWLVGIAGDQAASSSQTLEDTLAIGNTSGPYNIVMDDDQLIAHGNGSGDFGLRFTTDPVSTDIKWTYVHGDANGGYARVGVDNTPAEDWGVTRMQTRNIDNSGADIFMTQGDNNITLTTNDGTSQSLFDITPGILNANFNDGSTNYYSFLTADHFNTSLGSAYTAPNPGFPPYEYIGALNTKSGNGSGNETWAELRQTTEPSNEYSYIRSTNTGGAYPANKLEVGVVGTDWCTIEQKLGNITITSTNANFTGIEYDQDWHGNYTNRSLVDKEYVDGLVGSTPNLQSVLGAGNSSGNFNIAFNNDYGLVNSSGEGSIKLNAFQIDTEHKKFTNATDWKRGLIQANGNNGTSSIIGDDYNVTTDLYRAGSVDVTNTYSKIFYQETQISTGNGYKTEIQVNKDNILVNSAYNSSVINSNFAGLQYNHDYSANFTNRSIVDKEYVDNAVAGGGGGGSQTLAQTLALGNTAGIYDIDLNNNDLLNVENTDTNTLNIGSVITGTSHKNLGLDSTGRVVQVGNCSQEIFVYSFPNGVDNLNFYNDGLVRFGWDAPGNDLEFYMDTEPAGNTDIRCLATFNYGTSQNTFITTPGILYDIYGVGVGAGSQLNCFIVAEVDPTYPIYQVELYNASSNVTVKIIKTKKI